MDNYYKRLYELEKERREELENELRKIYMQKQHEMRTLQKTRMGLIQEIRESGQDFGSER